MLKINFMFIICYFKSKKKLLKSYYISTAGLCRIQDTGENEWDDNTQDALQKIRFKTRNARDIHANRNHDSDYRKLLCY